LRGDINNEEEKFVWYLLLYDLRNTPCGDRIICGSC
jgi:hypothetical protein